MKCCKTCYCILATLLFIQSTRGSEVPPQVSDVSLRDKKSISVAKTDKTVSRKQLNEDSDEEDDTSQNIVQSRSMQRKKTPKKPTTITIPIKNAVVQALTQVDSHEAEAASHKPSRHSPYEGNHGDIVYEDEMHELEGWLPPPPPPPEHLFRRPLIPATTLTSLSSIRAPSFMTGRLFGDDFALFLVILTIAGFFGLMLAMFMPFTFLMQQQPYAIGGGYGYPPYGQVATSGIYGYPPYGRRRRRSTIDSIFFESTDGILFRLSKALDKYNSTKRSRTRSHSRSSVHNILSDTLKLRSVQTHNDRL